MVSHIEVTALSGMQPELDHKAGERRRYQPERSLLKFSDSAPEPPRYIVDGLLPIAVGGLVGTGGSKKSTFALWLGLHITAGLPVFGRLVDRPGPVLFITAEDERSIIEYRVWHMRRALLSRLDDHESVRTQAAWDSGFHVEDLCGEVNTRLVYASRDGMAEARDVAEIIEAYRQCELSAVFVDPAIYFGPGEQFVNDGMAALMAVGKKLSRELDCAVCFIHHVSQSVARGDIIDAHSGRGGTAFGDNARFMFTVVNHKPEKSSQYPVPASMSMCEAPVRIHQVKNSFGPLLKQPLWFDRCPRDPWKMLAMTSDPPLTDEQKVRLEEVRLNRDVEVFMKWFTHRFPEGASKKTLEANRTLLKLENGKTSRERLRELIAEAENRGMVANEGSGRSSTIITTANYRELYHGGQQ
jgi:hypothetical protein